VEDQQRSAEESREEKQPTGQTTHCNGQLMLWWGISRLLAQTALIMWQPPVLLDECLCVHVTVLDWGKEITRDYRTSGVATDSQTYLVRRAAAARRRAIAAVPEHGKKGG
jgi:hypothetical protein